MVDVFKKNKKELKVHLSKLEDEIDKLEYVIKKPYFFGNLFYQSEFISFTPQSL